MRVRVELRHVVVMVKVRGVMSRRVLTSIEMQT